MADLLLFQREPSSSSPHCSRESAISPEMPQRPLLRELDRRQVLALRHPGAALYLEEWIDVFLSDHGT